MCITQDPVLLDAVFKFMQEKAQTQDYTMFLNSLAYNRASRRLVANWMFDNFDAVRGAAAHAVAATDALHTDSLSL